MNGLIVFTVFAFAVVMALAINSTLSAYRNGVNDGYGFSQEPDNPGYRKAGEYLRKYASHRWPLLKLCAECGEAKEAHTIEAARGDVGMDHDFDPLWTEWQRCSTPMRPTP